jgi:predicted DNA-binding antitoxin AbrB/MazE fold protein
MKVIDCIYENGVFKPLEKVDLKEGDRAKVILKEERKKALDKYVGIIKLDKPLTLEEILDMGEESWQC